MKPCIDKAGPRHIEYTTAQRKLASLARKLATNRDVLYHGTRCRQSILKTQTLIRPAVGTYTVSFTRSPEVAAYWALMDRDADDGRGSVFIFDRQSLERRYKIEANPEVFWHDDTTFHDEAEELIFDDVTKIGDHLIGIVSGPTAKLSKTVKILNREFENMMECFVATASQEGRCQLFFAYAAYEARLLRAPRDQRESPMTRKFIKRQAELAAEIALGLIRA